MAIIYVGPTSAGSANGTSWANRYGSLSAAEAKPVVAGDLIYCGPGVYRELLTCGVSGSSGLPITYIADVTGQNTDGIGGIVRITGSNNDQTATRANCITATTRSYRTFRGFSFDGTTGVLVNLITGCTNIIVEDCHFQNLTYNQNCILVNGANQANVTIRRCRFLMGGAGRAVEFTHTIAVDNTSHLIENCQFLGPGANVALGSTRIGNITVKNSQFAFSSVAVQVITALTAGQFMTVNNCIIAFCGTGLVATTTAEFAEDYNTISCVNTTRTTVTAGANSNTFPPLFNPLFLLAGFQMPQYAPFSLSQWSQVRRIAGTSEPTDDIFGVTRPATSAKKSWGAVQYADKDRETTTKRTGAASLKLADAGVHQMFVPVTNVSTVFSCYVQWEANYAGTKPQMIVKQPGQADVTVTAVGSSGAWELLTTTLTPAAVPSYCVVELRSNNTASGASIGCFFDDVAAT